MDVETDFTITGRLARFGRGGMIQDISNRLLKDFAECLQQKIEAPPAEPTQPVLTLGPPRPREAPPRRRPPSRSAASRSSSALLDRLRRVQPRLTRRVAEPAGSSRMNAGSIVCGIGDSR